MSENVTEEQPDGRPFEERVISALTDLRFDMNSRLDDLRSEMTTRFDQLDGRVQALEAKSYETKPIWERALAEVVELRAVMEDLFRSQERKQDVFARDLLSLRERQYQVEEIARRLDRRA